MQASAHIDTFARDNLPPPDQWPEFLLDGPDVAYPERLNCAAELVDAMVARGHGDRVALRWRQGADQAAMTYAELQALTNRIAHVLVEDLQLVPGNRLLLRGPNNAMMAASWLAAIKAGLVTVPTMPLLRAKELQQIIAKARVQAVLCDVRLKDEVQLCLQPGHEHHCPDLSRVLYFNDGAADALDALAAAKPDTFACCDTAADDVCLIAFTSGTTGAPKGCMHFHRDVLAMCDLFPRHVIRPSPDDIFCGTPPLAFTFGLGGLLCFPLRVGASTVLAESSRPKGCCSWCRISAPPSSSPHPPSTGRWRRRQRASTCRHSGKASRPARPAGRHAPAVEAGHGHRDDRRHRRHRADPRLCLQPARGGARGRHRQGRARLCGPGGG